MNNLFKVIIDGLSETDKMLAYSKVFYHGINKSGSGALSTPIRAAFLREGRGNRFISPYFAFPRCNEEFYKLINSVSDPFFAVNHYLYKSPLTTSPKWISMVRHPLPRVLSVYNWLKKKHINESNAPFPHLIDFVRGTKGIKHSQFVQFAVGYADDSKLLIKSKSAEKLFDMALENMEKDFHFVGVAEYFEETLWYLAGSLGLNYITPWVKDIRNLDRIEIHELSQEEREMILDFMKYDLMLYQIAKKKFLKKIEDLSLGGDFLAYQNVCKSGYRERII